MKLKRYVFNNTGFHYKNFNGFFIEAMDWINMDTRELAQNLSKSRRTGINLTISSVPAR